jgi:6-phosphogluconolactonase
MAHELFVEPDPAAAAGVAALLIAQAVDGARHHRSRPGVSVAFSGGTSPRRMLAELASMATRPGLGAANGWADVDVFQVDERVAPDGDPARNVVDLHRRLADHVVPAARLHPIPVELGPEAAADAYAATLATVLGPQGGIDVVHLGLGDDGHTASLLPGDGALGVTDRDVAATGEYQGHRRVTLTYPALGRAALAVWLVTGASKAEALAALLRGDPGIPASHVRAGRSVIVADQAAAEPRLIGAAGSR